MYISVIPGLGRDYIIPGAWVNSVGIVKFLVIQDAPEKISDSNCLIKQASGIIS